jgi:peroxiredoxin
VLTLVLSALAATPKVGERAPAFALTDANGQTVSLGDYAGKSKLVVVFFRGDW